MPIQNFQPEICQCCGQSMTYLLPVDKGTVDILKAFSVAIRKKGINEIHPRNEMEVQRGQLSYGEMVGEGVLTSNHVGNLSRLRFHGLIAAIDGKKGFYLLTRKGAAFLRGDRIPKYAIISKAKGHQIGYFEEFTENCTINDFADESAPYWQLINFDVSDKKIILLMAQQAKLL
jgi:hypothetical protein